MTTGEAKHARSLLVDKLPKSFENSEQLKNLLSSVDNVTFCKASNLFMFYINARLQGLSNNLKLLQLKLATDYCSNFRAVILDFPWVQGISKKRAFSVQIQKINFLCILCVVKI